MVSTLHVSSTQLAECWAAYSLNKNVQELDSHSFESFRTQVIKECGDKVGEIGNGAVITRVGKRQSAATNIPSVTPPSKRPNIAGKSADDNSTSNSMDPAPPSALRSSDSVPVLNLEKYEDRREPGKVVKTFNPDMLDASAFTARKSTKCTVSYADFESNVKESYRHMFTTNDERANALDRHLVEMGDQMIERYNLGQINEVDESADVAGLEAVGIPRQDKICCIGRICNSVSLHRECDLR